MPRYSPEHKEATRRRMIEAAGRRFKSDGFDGAGIATLVADAGLTNGAFYGHFDSKDDLIAAVVADQLDSQVARIDALPAGLDSVATFLEEYLSPAHRDDIASGCPSAALLDEIARSSPQARAAYTEGSRSMIEAIARHLDTGDHDAARTRAIGLFTMLVASLQLARAVDDPELSDQVLAAARANAITLATGQDPR
ncbi:TetR/AcrR family transcriptional regulator [Nocardioides ultimimeridianus]